MRLIKSIGMILIMSFFSCHSFAGVYKCTDNKGNTAYQALPCADKNKSQEINIQTGGSIDISIKLKQQENSLKLKQQQKDEAQQKIDLEENRLKQAAEQSALNQQLVKNNPVQYSAFAIPPYRADKLPDLVKEYESRLPEIEKFRRFAAQKALKTGQCRRVESDELSIKSTLDILVFSVNCSTAKTFFYNEIELAKQ